MANIAPPVQPLNLPHLPEGGDVGRVQSGWRLGLEEFARNRLAVVGLGLLVFFVIFCFIGPIFYHGNIITTAYTGVLAPGPGHPLGTNDQGFDELGLLMNGGQASLEVGFLAAAFAIIIGALWGAIAGLAGGIIDSIMMRIVDVFLSIPVLFVVLIVAVKYGATVLSLGLIIGAFTWLVQARLVRGEVLTLRVRDFVSAARTSRLQPVAADQQAPDTQRARDDHRQRDLQRRRRHPVRRRTRLPRVRPALPDPGLG